MPQDDITTTTGQRPGRVRRSQSPDQINPGSINTSSQDFIRAVPKQLGNNMGVLSGFAEDMSRFFQGRAKQAFADDVKAETERNNEAIAAAQAKVSLNREKAVEAIKSGDHSFFLPDNELRQRKVVQQSFNQMVATEAAVMDFERELKTTIASTPVGGNPRDSVEAYAREALKGANPTYANQYMSVVGRLAEKEIATWNEARREAVIASTDNTNTTVFRGLLQNNEITSINHLETAITKAATSYAGLPTDLAFERARAMAEDEVMKWSLTGGESGTIAFNLMMTPDPKKDGTTIAGRRKVDLAKLREGHILAQRRVASMNEQNSIQTITEGIDSLVRGTPEPGYETPDLIIQKLNHHFTSHGSRAQESQFRAAWTAVLKLKGDDKDMISITKDAFAQRTSASRKVWNKHWITALNGTMAQRMMNDNPNLTFEQAQGRALNYAANMGLPAEGKKYLTNQIQNTANIEETLGAMRTIAALAQASGTNVRNMLAEGEDGDHAHALMQAAEASGDTAPEVIRKMKDNASNSDIKVRGAFSTLYDSAESTKAGKKTRVSQNNVFKAVADQLGSTFSFDADRNSFAYRKAARYLDLAAYYLQFDSTDVDAIEELATKWMATDVVVGRDAKGTKVLVPDYTPSPMMGADGRVVRSRPVTLDSQDDVTNKVRETRPLGNFLGDGVNVSADPHTKRGMGYKITSDSGAELMWSPRAPITLERDDLGEDSAGIDAIFTTTRLTGDTWHLEAPPAPGQGDPRRITVSPNVALLWDSRDNVWRLRATEDYPQADIQAMEKTRQLNMALDVVTRGENVSQRMRATVRRIDPPGDRPPAPIGSTDPDAPDGPSTNSDVDADKQALDEYIDSLATSGKVSPETALRLKNQQRIHDGSLESNIAAVDASAAEMEAERNNPTPEPNDVPSFMHRARKLIRAEEGFVPFAYNDAFGQAAGGYQDTDKTKGNPTVGDGFLLSRKDARAVLEALGVDYDAILNNKAHLNNVQGDALLDFIITEARDNVVKHHGATTLKQHQLLALTELAVNCPECAMGPKISAAIKDGDWKEAENQIRNFSLNVKKLRAAGHSSSAIQAMRVRRHRTADLFAGVGNEDPIGR